MNKHRLLVIEDCEEVRDNLAETLELFGYLVTTATNGKEGVKFCFEDPPDLVLCDVRMKELDGYGVIRLLAEDERTAGIPFVFITAKTEPEEISRAMHLGAAGYITKPFYKDELLRVIRAQLTQLV